MKIIFAILGWAFLALFVIGFFLNIGEALKFGFGIDKWSELFKHNR
jgi:hypothetical protein